MNAKKILAIVLALAMIVCTLNVSVFALTLEDLQDSINNGDGEIILNGDLDLSEDGSQEHPICIDTVEELKEFRDKVNAGETFEGKYINLVADLDLEQQEWTPIGNATNKFKGYFDGCGHIISNLWVAGNEFDHAGLFGYVLGSAMNDQVTPSIQNLVLDSASVLVSGTKYVGALAGQIYTAYVKNVTVTNTEVWGGNWVGGITGHSYARYDDCHFEGVVVSNNQAGGITGAGGDARCYGCTVDVSADYDGYNGVNGSSWVGGIVGNGQEGSSAVDCYVKGNIYASGNWYRGVGGIAGVANHGYEGSQYVNNYFNGEVFLEDVKIDVPLVGFINADSNDDVKTEFSGNSWNTEYYPADLEVAIVAPNYGSNATMEQYLASAKEMLPRNNNLVMLESDLAYIDADSADDVVIMEGSSVTEADVEAAIEKNNRPALPTATVTDITAAELEASGAPDLTFAKRFTAVTPSPEALAYYSDWYADYVLTVNKDVKFNINGGDAYLAGSYQSWENGAWVSIPDFDYSLAANTPINVMEAAMQAMGYVTRFTYGNVIDLVQVFDCGIFFTPEYLAANPDLVVTLELCMINPEDTDEVYTIGETYIFKAEDLIPEIPTATIEEVPAEKLATAAKPLTFAKRFIADTPSPEALAYYSEWYADYVLTINKDVTFNVNGDAYLSGSYDWYQSGAWVNIPDFNYTLPANTPINVMEAAMQAMGYTTRFTYGNVIDLVQVFDCGIFFSPEFLAANPGLKVTLELCMINPEDTDEVYVIGETFEFESVDVVAKVGDVGYATLQEAIDAADGKTITVLKDIELTSTATVAKDKTVTIDLNGKIISGVDSVASTSAVILNKGNLTVKDSATGGKITCSALYPDTSSMPTYANNTIRNEGTFTLESGIIENNTNAPACYAIDSYSTNSLVTINGGEVLGNRCAIRLFANSTTATNSLVINGGTVAAKRAIWVHLPGSKDEKKLASVTVTGGVITSTQPDADCALYVYSFGDSFDGTSLTISGGEFNGYVGVGGGSDNNGSGSETVIVTGGTFDCGVTSYKDEHNIAISGGTYGEPVPADYCAEGYVPVENSDGTYGVEEGEMLDTGIYAALGYKPADAADDYQYAILLTAGIDSLAYKTAGFTMTIDGVSQDFYIDGTVWTSLTLNLKNNNETVVLTPDQYSADSNYIMYYIVTFSDEILETVGDKEFSVSAFVVTFEGEKISTKTLSGWGVVKQ